MPELAPVPDQSRYSGLDIRSHPYEKITTVATTTAVAHDPFEFYLMQSGSPQTFTIPPASAVPYDMGSVITLLQSGTGPFTIVAGAGVTIATSLTSLISKGQWNIAQVMNIGVNQWVAFGGLGG